MAGLGAVLHTGNVQPGDSVAVFGCGGVGDAAIAGAKLAGATTIVAVDIDARKLEGAKAFGATHVVDSTAEDPVDAVRRATGGFGADVCVEAVGHPKVLEQAFYARDLATFQSEIQQADADVRQAKRLASGSGSSRGGGPSPTPTPSPSASASPSPSPSPS